MSESAIPNVTPWAKSGFGDDMEGGTYTPPGYEPVESDPEPVPEQPDTGGTGVPSGTVADVLDWVGSDPDRAKAAIDAENESGKPRSTLLAALEQIASA